MKRLMMIAAAAALTATAVAAVYQEGEVRNMKFPDMKIVLRLVEDDGETYWRINEDAPIFALRFAKVYASPDMFNKAEGKELAKAVAVAIANHIGSTNSVRVVHKEVPPPAGSNILERVEAWLKGKDVVDEIVPLELKSGNN